MRNVKENLSLDSYYLSIKHFNLVVVLVFVSNFN